MNADDKESVVVMGAGAVGKSALVVRFTTDTFVEVKGLRKKIQRIKETVREMAGDEKLQSFIPLILVGNKCDLTDEREVTKEEATRLAENEWEVPFFETSAKTNINVEACFHQLIREIKKSKNEWEVPFFETSAKT